MNRGGLNLYLEGLLSLSSDKSTARLILIREALSAASLVELLQEWVWIQGLDHTSALKLKIWFQLSYRELSEVFNCSIREVVQLLRNQRLQLLPVYRPEKAAQGVMSCFMVEQYLSVWMDCEISERKTIEDITDHLKACSSCHDRLIQFRNLQSLILNSRGEASEIDEMEWNEALRYFQSENRKRLWKITVFGMVVLAVSLLLAWAIFAKPEKMPNVYEIQG